MPEGEYKQGVLFSTTEEGGRQRKPCRKLTPEDRVEVRRLYEEEKLTCPQIAERIGGITRDGIFRFLQRSGVQTRSSRESRWPQGAKPKPPKKVRHSLIGREQEVVDLYNSGRGGTEIAEMLGVNTTLVYEALWRSNVEMRTVSEGKRGRKHRRQRRICQVDESVFDTVTEESAYWIGFLMADGCVAAKSDGQSQIVLSIQERDRDHLEAFRAFLKSEHKISSFESQQNEIAGRKVRTGKHVRLTVPSQRMADALSRFGVVPRKSLEAKVIGLENNPDFWRGMVDGDGTVTRHHSRIVTDGRDGSYWVPRLFLCGSRHIVEQFREFVLSVAPHFAANIKPHNKIFTLFVTGSAGFAVIDRLYGNCEVALRRKHESAREILSEWKPRVTLWRDVTLEQLDVKYASLGSWLAVAESLGTTVAVVKGIRKRLGRKTAI